MQHKYGYSKHIKQQVGLPPNPYYTGHPWAEMDRNMSQTNTLAYSSSMEWTEVCHGRKSYIFFLNLLKLLEQEWFIWFKQIENIMTALANIIEVAQEKK